MFLTYIYITLLLPSFVLTLCICLDYFIEGHRVISYTSTVTCYPLKIKSLPLPLPLPLAKLSSFQSHQPKTITGNRSANDKCHFVRLVC